MAGGGPPSRILLFDVDGTLLLGSGAGRAAMDIAAREVFGIAANVQPTAGVDFAGASDLRVLREIASAHGHEYDSAAHHRFLPRFAANLRLTLSDRPVRALPGVSPLLQRLQAEPALLALGTGNFRETAFMKLAHVGLDRYFDSTPESGCFGEDGVTRPEFLRVGIERLRPLAAKGAEVVVIGDTVLDVEGARAVGARVVAVATGFSEREALQEAGPDVLLDDLCDLDIVLDALLS